MNEEDKYIWMENLDDPRVLDFIDRENKKLREYLGDSPNILAEEIKKYFYVTSLMHAELTSDGFFALFRKQDRFTLERFYFDSMESEKILDSKELGEDIMIVGFKYHEPLDYLIYWVSKSGSDITTLNVLDLKSGEIILKLEGSIWDIVFLTDQKYYYTMFYRTEKTPDGVSPPTSRVILREGDEETIVFGKGLPTNHFILTKESLDRSKMIINVSFGWSWGKIYGGDLEKPDKWNLLYETKDSVPKVIDYVNGAYYLISYGEKTTGELLKVNEKGEEEVIIPEGDYPLNNGIAMENELLLEYLVDAVSVVKSINLKTGEIVDVFGRQYYSYHFLNSKDRRSLIYRTTFWMPYQLILYENGDRRILLSEEFEGDYEVEDNFTISNDGTKVHYFEVKRKGAAKNIAYIYGYGGFAISITPTYLFDLLKLLEDGFTYVLTNLRGGSEYGEKWHKQGMLKNKMNVFYDYISVLNEMKKRNFKTIASGGSNGGLLIGATLNMRPELIDIALIGYPVLDMLRFHKLYIGRAWVPEYGDPENEEDREYLLKYSPYHNIDKNKKYPRILVYTGLHDDRVHPSHALKYVAKMREIGASVFLRVETKSGHIGSTPEIRLKERADILAFIYKTLDLL